MRAMSSIRPWRDIDRRKSRQIMVGSVPVGGDAPVTVQTMTNTPTEDAKATIDQIRRCEDAGADIMSGQDVTVGVQCQLTDEKIEEKHQETLDIIDNIGIPPSTNLKSALST